MASAIPQPFAACPTAEDVDKAFSAGGLRTAECAWCLQRLGVAPERNLTARRAQLSRILGDFPNYARASLWLFRAQNDGDRSPAFAVSDLLPAALGDDAMEPLRFDPPGGVDLEHEGDCFARTQVPTGDREEDSPVPLRQPPPSPGSFSPRGVSPRSNSPIRSPPPPSPSSQVGFDAEISVPDETDLSDPGIAARFLRQLGL